MGWAATRAKLIAEPERESRRRLHISESMRRFGGYRQGSGQGKKGWYQGYWCDSTYELVYVIYNLDHGIAFSRNTERLEYVCGSRKATWMPDFILPDGVYVEIKGYEDARARAKFDQFSRSLRVLKREDMNEMFSYVESRYGRDLVRLYEHPGPV